MINGVAFGVLVSFNRGQFPPAAVAHLRKRIVRQTRTWFCSRRPTVTFNEISSVVTLMQWIF